MKVTVMHAYGTGPQHNQMRDARTACDAAVRKAMIGE